MNPESRTDWQRIDALSDDEINEAILVDLDAAPVITGEDFACAQSAANILPQVVDWHRRGRGLQRTPTKVPVSIRLSPEVIAYFKAQGKGWQSRLNEILQQYVASHG